MNRRSNRSRQSASQPSPVGGRRASKKALSQDAGEPKKKSGRGQQQSMTQFLEPADESQTQKASKVPPITEDQVQEQANLVVYFLISCTRDGSSVTRSEIQKTVLRNFHSKHFATILTKAAEILKDVFALEMKNLDGDEDKFDKLILVDTQGIPKPTESDEDKATQTLLLLMLNCIHVAGGTIKEEQLLNFFKELNISFSKSDGSFGDVEGKINTFKSQSYLKFEVDKSTIPPTKLILLGPRANAEINKLEMLSFSKKLYPDLAFLQDATDKLLLANDTEEDTAEDSD